MKGSVAVQGQLVVLTVLGQVFSGNFHFQQTADAIGVSVDGSVATAAMRGSDGDSARRISSGAGHHVVGFRCATSEDLGEVAPGGRLR